MGIVIVEFRSSALSLEPELSVLVILVSCNVQNLHFNHCYSAFFDLSACFRFTVGVGFCSTQRGFLVSFDVNIVMCIR